ncbi:hypothetical protein [Propionibacterium australiense]|nr:hypothetical protein [Propionibacterium australiense]RLP06433.1 hypothetical protein D9T14_12205 [Propionibacterium australiense]RLP06840.1 hypothetical protein D7U36_12140 [Propionibacterium australiense]
MMMTTIKIGSATRDRLKAAAARHRRTLGEQIDAMLVEEGRGARLRKFREQIAANPPDQSYFDELEEWQSDRW